MRTFGRVPRRSTSRIGSHDPFGRRTSRPITVRSGESYDVLIATYSVPFELTAAFMWSSAMPSPTLRAEEPAGTSSAVHVEGDAPSTWVRKPKRFVFWFDQNTPMRPGSATTSEMSSSAMPDATVIGDENDEYGASAQRTWIWLDVSVASHMRPVLSRSIVAVSLPGSETEVAVVRDAHGT